MKPKPIVLPQKRERAADGGQEYLPTVVDTAPSLFGCTPLFDICTDADLMSLSFQGSAPFLDWLGWVRTQTCVIKRRFIDYVRAEGTAGEGGEIPTPGYLSNPCAVPDGVEFATCDFTLTDFARLRRAGPVRDITKAGINYCAQQPRYRLDGSVITDQTEWDMRLATEVLMQDLKRMVIDGNAGSPGQFDGLEQLVKTGYTNANGVPCAMMDSIVVDMNDNPMSGGAGMTWNGSPIAATVGGIDILMAIYRRIRHRIRMSPSLASQNLTPGSMVLLLPEDFAPCILDAYTCWSVCDQNITINSLDARNFRNGLNGGTYGAGRIFLDGFEIPILPYDWGLINPGGANFDAYLLTGNVGSVKLINGEYNDMAPVAASNPNRYSTDSGLILTWDEFFQTCMKQFVEMQPRLLMWAPWAQARIENMMCQVPGGIMSEDPWNTYFPYP
jgi:hypothetical protein